jgi:hypothetical protein
MKHKQIALKGRDWMGDEWSATVDEGCAELVRLLNDSGLVRTFCSCQGGSRKFELGYVAIEDDVTSAWLLSAMTVEMDKRRRRVRDGKITFYFLTAIGGAHINALAPVSLPAAAEGAQDGASARPLRRACPKAQTLTNASTSGAKRPGDGGRRAQHQRR